MFQIKVLDKIKIRILYPIIFLRKSLRLWENFEESDGARETADDNTYVGTLRAGLVRLVARKYTPTPMQAHKHTHTHTYTNVQHLLLFHGNNIFVEVTHYYVTRTLLVLFEIQTVWEGTEHRRLDVATNMARTLQ